MMTKKAFIVLTFVLLCMSCSMTGQSVRTVSGSEDNMSLLVGPVWKWIYTINKDGGKDIPPDSKNYTVQFLESGILKVKADCNVKGGMYSVQRNRLIIEITYSTMAACGENSLEDQFVRDLMAGGSFFLKDRELFIDLNFDSGRMTFFTEKSN
jgi:heat shock protein HslJ